MTNEPKSDQTVHRSRARVATAAIAAGLTVVLVLVSRVDRRRHRGYPRCRPTSPSSSTSHSAYLSSGFGAAGPVQRTPVIFLHGNNDTPFPTACNPFGSIHNFAQFFADHGYSPSELWGLGYQGDQCDLITSPTNRSGLAHSTLANVPDLRSFVEAVLKYTGCDRSTSSPIASGSRSRANGCARTKRTTSFAGSWPSTARITGSSTAHRRR